MIKVLFICHGNICRSPMAEYAMKHIVREAGLEDRFLIASAATPSILLPAMSWQSTGSPAWVMPPGRWRVGTMTAGTISSAWTNITDAT